MLLELTKPLSVLDDDDNDDDVEHLVCCDENISLCGEDVSDRNMIDDSDGLSYEGVCVICVALHVTGLPCSPNCPFM